MLAEIIFKKESLYEDNGVNCSRIAGTLEQVDITGGGSVYVTLSGKRLPVFSAPLGKCYAEYVMYMGRLSPEGLPVPVTKSTANMSDGTEAYIFFRNIIMGINEK